MHRAAAAAAAAGFPAIEFGEHGADIAAFGQIVAVRPVRAHHFVLLAQMSANSDRHSFLADAQVDRTAHLFLTVTLRDAPLDNADAQHLQIQAPEPIAYLA